MESTIKIKKLEYIGSKTATILKNENIKTKTSWLDNWDDNWISNT